MAENIINILGKKPNNMTVTFVAQESGLDVEVNETLKHTCQLVVIQILNALADML